MDDTPDQLQADEQGGADRREAVQFNAASGRELLAWQTCEGTVTSTDGDRIELHVEKPSRSDILSIAKSRFSDAGKLAVGEAIRIDTVCSRERKPDAPPQESGELRDSLEKLIGRLRERSAEDGRP